MPRVFMWAHQSPDWAVSEGGSRYKIYREFRRATYARVVGRAFRGTRGWALQPIDRNGNPGLARDGYRTLRDAVLAAGVEC